MADAKLSDVQSEAIEAVDEGLNSIDWDHTSLADAVKTVKPDPDPDSDRIVIMYDPAAEYETHLPGKGRTVRVLGDHRVETGIFAQQASVLQKTVNDLPGPNPPKAIARFVDSTLDFEALAVKQSENLEALLLEVR